jgi:cell division protein FtsL
MANAKTVYSKVAAPRRFEAVYSQRWDLFVPLIVIMVLLTLVSVFHVWSRAKVIDLNLRISDVKRQMKEQEQEHNRLKVEVASLKTPARIESLAKGALGMALPTEQQVVSVR